MIYWNAIGSKFGKDQEVYFWFIYDKSRNLT